MLLETNPDDRKPVHADLIFEAEKLFILQRKLHKLSQSSSPSRSRSTSRPSPPTEPELPQAQTLSQNHGITSTTTRPTEPAGITTVPEEHLRPVLDTKKQAKVKAFFSTRSSQLDRMRSSSISSIATSICPILEETPFPILPPPLKLKDVIEDHESTSCLSPKNCLPLNAANLDEFNRRVALLSPAFPSPVGFSGSDSYRHHFPDHPLTRNNKPRARPYPTEITQDLRRVFVEAKVDPDPTSSVLPVVVKCNHVEIDVGSRLVAIGEHPMDRCGFKASLEHLRVAAYPIRLELLRPRFKRERAQSMERTNAETLQSQQQSPRKFMSFEWERYHVTLVKSATAVKIQLDEWSRIQKYLFLHPELDTSEEDQEKHKEGSSALRSTTTGRRRRRSSVAEGNRHSYAPSASYTPAGVANESLARFSNRGSLPATKTECSPPLSITLPQRHSQSSLTAKATPLSFFKHLLSPSKKTNNPEKQPKEEPELETVSSANGSSPFIPQTSLTHDNHRPTVAFYFENDNDESASLSSSSCSDKPQISSKEVLVGKELTQTKDTVASRPAPPVSKGNDHDDHRHSSAKTNLPLTRNTSRSTVSTISARSSDNSPFELERRASSRRGSTTSHGYGHQESLVDQQQIMQDVIQTIYKRGGMSDSEKNLLLRGVERIQESVSKLQAIESILLHQQLQQQ